MERLAKQQKIQGSKKKMLLLGLGVLGTATLAYFGYRYWKGKRVQASDELPDISSAGLTRPRGSARPGNLWHPRLLAPV